MRRPLLLALATIAFATACGPSGPDLRGGWTSQCVTPGNQQAFSLDFDIQSSTWSLDYAVYGESTSCATPFLTVGIQGPWAYQEPSSTVSGAWEARFGFTDKTVTPHSDAAVAFLSSAQGCNRGGFAVGVATSIFAEGCAGLGQYPGTACQADYDLVSLDQAGLQFGSRPANNDMCAPEKRPTALSGLALQRK